MVRDADASELAEIGRLRVGAYVAGGSMSPQSQYAPVLAALGADGTGPVLVAVDDDRVLGTVMLQFWPDGGQLVHASGEAEIRALAVAPEAQGRGIGRALLRAAIGRAARQPDIRHLLLLTQPEMLAAQHLYRQAGFTRLPERDWSPREGITLLAYSLPLPAAGRPGPADPAGAGKPGTPGSGEPADPGQPPRADGTGTRG
jgi:ribosomal protein S18 acetylase RimI-like enzyme